MRKPRVDSIPTRFRLADVEAVLEELYVIQREWHGGMSPERRGEILKTFFNVEESAT